MVTTDTFVGRGDKGIFQRPTMRDLEWRGQPKSDFPSRASQQERAETDGGARDKRQKARGKRQETKDKRQKRPEAGGTRQTRHGARCENMIFRDDRTKNSSSIIPSAPHP